MGDYSHELVDDARLQHLHPYSPSVQMLQSFGVKTARAIATTAASAATLSLTSDYCGKCRHFEFDDVQTELRREFYGGHLPEVYRCDKLGVIVEPLDSPQNPSSAAAGCIYYNEEGHM